MKIGINRGALIGFYLLIFILFYLIHHCTVVGVMLVFIRLTIDLSKLVFVL